jgi:hypothetical protein
VRGFDRLPGRKEMTLVGEEKCSMRNLLTLNSPNTVPLGSV